MHLLMFRTSSDEPSMALTSAMKRANTLASVNEHGAITQAKVGVSDLLRGNTSELLTRATTSFIVASAAAVPSLSRGRHARVHRGLQKIVRLREVIYDNAEQSKPWFQVFPKCGRTTHGLGHRRRRARGARPRRFLTVKNRRPRRRGN